MNELKIYLDQISKYPVLTEQQEKDLARLAYAGDKTAQNKLVMANLRFVVTVAGSYKVKNVSIMDLIEEGNIGLITAAQKFDPSKNVRLITYAVLWIRQSIRKFLYENGKSVKIPLNRKDEFLDSKWNFSSLDTPRGDDDESCIGNFIEDSRNLTPEEACIKKFEKEHVNKLLKTLKPNEQAVLKMRFGFDLDKPMSLEEVGHKINYTKEGVRQIEKKSLSKLKRLMDDTTFAA